MAFTANTGDEKVTRSDVFLVSPKALVVNWRKNLSRGGEMPPVDEALIELAKDMMPRQGAGDSEEGSSGQLNPILTRPLADKRLEVVGGFRRMRAALYLIESGLCPDFRVKYIVSRMSDAEAGLVNICENMQREDPKPIQLAHAIRSLNEDYGMTWKQIAGRLKRSELWIANMVNLVTLPAAIQSEVATGKVAVSAALELAKLPSEQQAEVFDSLASSGEKITATKVKAKAVADSGKPVPLTMSQFRFFLGSIVHEGGSWRHFAGDLLALLDGTKTTEVLKKEWFI